MKVKAEKIIVRTCVAVLAIGGAALMAMPVVGIVQQLQNIERKRANNRRLEAENRSIEIRNDELRIEIQRLRKQIEETKRETEKIERQRIRDAFTDKPGRAV